MAPIESPHTQPRWDPYCTWGGWGEQDGCRRRRMYYSMYCPTHLRQAIATGRRNRERAGGAQPDDPYEAALLQAIAAWEQDREKTG
jgi:hypothetical protein